MIPASGSPLRILMRLNLACALLAVAPAAWAGSGLTYSTCLRQGFTPNSIATSTPGTPLMVYVWVNL